MHEWSPTSWQNYAYQQSAVYPDNGHLERVVAQLGHVPQLVTSNEINQLKQNMARAGRGECFILQGGDCAESFAECHPDNISNKLKILLQMSLILLHGLKKPIIRIGRIAGQYTKPRSCDFETIDGVTLPSYRGDLVNSRLFTLAARTPDPELLMQGYNCSAVTLNYIRAVLNSGFADLKHLQNWDFDTIEHSKQTEAYQAIVQSMTALVDIVASLNGATNTHLNLSEFFTSHEALHLHYEQALTRRLQDGNWYNVSTHLPWIGMRTATLDSAHVELLRGVQNPIGIKIGAHATPEWLIDMLQRLNPNQEEGRILLITRMGTSRITETLPVLIEAVKKHDLPVTWSCDPMHGNTEITAFGVKTRHFDTILQELKLAISIHRELGSCLGGVHFELTGENVTECVGGARGLTEHDLENAYHSLVDPRLNYEQSLEMAIQLSHQY